MSTKPSNICAILIAVFCLNRAAAEEPGSQMWNEVRAEVFSSVCMATSPDFDEVPARALEAGMSKSDGAWLLAPDIVLNLQEHDGFCSCSMAARAQHTEKMIQALFERLMSEFGDYFTGPDNGLNRVAPFERNGVEVVSIIEPRKVGDEQWIIARATVFGSCPEFSL